MRHAAACLIWLAGAVACRSPAGITRPLECADPCCGGNPDGVDCAENPDLACFQPADACPGARSYGCRQGAFFQAPLAACTAIDASGDVDQLVVPDAAGE
jgi:hypothetical protein